LTSVVEGTAVLSGADEVPREDWQRNRYRILDLSDAPSTNNSMPFTKLESLEARKSAAVAISSGR
jgi:hypothetical protein